MLFKILHGDAARISTDITPFHEGYCYVTHDGGFYVDMNNERVKLNSRDAETLCGLSFEEIQKNVAAKSAIISLLAANWTGDADPYAQVVALSNITTNSKIDLQPTIAQLSDLLTYGIALQAINEDGVVTVYATGGKPVSDYDMQVFITETEVV